MHRPEKKVDLKAPKKLWSKPVLTATSVKQVTRGARFRGMRDSGMFTRS